MDYVSAPSSEDNIFVDILNVKYDIESLILFRGKLSFIIMNLFPYNNGHLMVVPYRKVQSMVELRDDELKEIMYLAKKSMSIISNALNSDGFNFGLNISCVGGKGGMSYKEALNQNHFLNSKTVISIFVDGTLCLVLLQVNLPLV